MRPVRLAGLGDPRNTRPNGRGLVPMRVRIDPVRCGCSGFCERIAPGVFALPPSGASEVIDATPAPDQHDAVREAATMCPTGAIIVEDD